MIELDSIGKLLTTARTVAVVGCSAKPARPSYQVAAYLQSAGYRVIPVNPGLDEVLGERCYPDLQSIPGDSRIDIVDVFRRSEAVPPIAEAAVEKGARALWLQLGVSNPEAERLAAAAGLIVISNRCIKIEHATRF